MVRKLIPKTIENTVAYQQERNSMIKAVFFLCVSLILSLQPNEEPNINCVKYYIEMLKD